MTPRLVAITDLDRASAEEMLVRFGALAELARPGSVMFQLRDTSRSVRERLVLGRGLAALCRRTGQLFAVNDRVDLALLLGADALHLGEASLDTPDARRLWGERFVSRACHDPLRARALDADALLLSPVLVARKGRPALGLEVVRRVCASLAGSREAIAPSQASGGPEPAAAAAEPGPAGGLLHAVAARVSGASRRPLLFALGGVDAAGAADCLAAGADGVAMLGAVLGGEPPEAVVHALGIAR